MAPGRHTLTRDAVGTRYVMVGIRTLVNPTDPEDVRKVHALQDAMTSQPGIARQTGNAAMGPGEPEEGA